VLIDRAEAPVDFGVPLFTSFRVDARAYAAEELPEALAAVPLIKPGTRASA
jgi:orotate phosphoribosyltransferase